MVTPATGGPRLLLRRLREIMAERVSAQARLDKVVRLIAANMVAEVCSIYLMRPGAELELFATEGLNPSAVHKTRMKKGEGLVGDIALNARPLNLTDAPKHPHFSYRPETGEDPYQSFLGVPILRGGRALGVLVVQNRTRRHYDEEETEALQTVAMVLAEMVGAGELIDQSLLEETGVRRDRPYRFKGTVFADGLAIGTAVLHEPRVTVERLIAEDTKRERERLDTAIADLRAYVDEMLSGGAHLEGETREVLEAYAMFAYDSGWVERIREAIETGLTAEASVEKVHSETRARLLRQSDAYLRERLHDLDDLAAFDGRRRYGGAADASGERGAARAHDGSGGTTRLRPHAAQSRGAGGRFADRACLHRRARARDRGRGAVRRIARPLRNRQRGHRRRRDGRRSFAADGGSAQRL